MKGKNEKDGVMSGLSKSNKIKTGPECVSVPTGGNQVPVKKATKVGKHKIR